MRFRGSSIFKTNEMAHCVALYSETKEGGTKRRKLTIGKSVLIE